MWEKPQTIHFPVCHGLKEREKRDKINKNESQSPPRVHHKYHINQKCQFTNIINYAKLLIQLYSGQGINLLGIFFFF